jgi:predicted nucleotidyltransferase
LAAAYLFGSSLSRSDYNDIDVALVFSEGARAPAERELAEIALALDKAFHAETDLHLATDLPDAILFRVVRDGVRFLTLDPLAAVRFEADTLTRFLDFKPAYDWLTSRILQRQAW